MRIQAVYCRCVGKRGFGASAVKELLGCSAVKTVVYVIKLTVAVVILTLPTYRVERANASCILDDIAVAPSVVLIRCHLSAVVKNRHHVVPCVFDKHIRICLRRYFKAGYSLRVVYVSYFFFSVSVFSKQLCSVVIVLRCFVSRFVVGVFQSVAVCRLRFQSVAFAVLSLKHKF